MMDCGSSFLQFLISKCDEKAGEGKTKTDKIT